LLELSWNICPYCSASQVSQDTTDWVYQQQPTARTRPPQARPSTSYEPQPAETLEYIEGDDY
jgi:hypothetical protein